ncbi:hypothetical protein Poli38472_003711 [Pythium oligandrum]|uniref:DUF6818 domain-containing protein n=1 Tax=Pythium oligandrum TaxID=41045 RepID=A0A8K1CLQ8_PYTOL|nr:hypothetical protein Poli38472_003711 [Pythium oligandrum]|eukprot:TMW65946.1 hypothetical protein Poli38472_003711 [Pythium oligandrum]
MSSAAATARTQGPTGALMAPTGALDAANAAAVVASVGVASGAQSSPSAASASDALHLRRVGPPRGSKAVGARHSSKFGTVNYSIDEMRRLNEKVRAVMPIASEDWLHVAYQFNYLRPESIPYREVESLKRKFKKMYCSRAGAGEQLPDYIVEAKELRKLINQRSERAQLQLEQMNSDTQSELDAQDPTTASAVSAGDEGKTPRAESPDGESVPGEEQPDGPATTEGGGPEDGNYVGGEDTREITARLRQMEEEYHRSMSNKRPGSEQLPIELPSTPGSSGTFGLPFAAPTSASPDATSGFIHLLKHSIERKRRTVEEQMLSESERVRKERKKRKMEQALYNIHREHELSTTTSQPSPSSSLAAGAATSPLQPGAPSYQALLNATVSPDPSVHLMEVVLQYLMTQQQDTARRLQEEDERRRKADEEKARRRRIKETQRRQDKRELMLVMAALLQENFPSELRHYLDEPVGDDSNQDDDASATNGTDPTPPSSALNVVENALL